MSTKPVDVPAEIKNCRPIPIEIGSHAWMMVESRFWRMTNKRGPDDCWDWTGSGHNKDGRGLLTIDGKRYFASRISWAIHHRQDPGQKFALHKCDNPPCVNPAHLFLGSYVDNNRDKCAKGRHHYQRDPNASYVVKNAGKIPFRVGEDVRHLAKLTEADVIAIRATVRDGGMCKAIGKRYPRREVMDQLAEKYGISFSNLIDIFRERTWRYLLPNYDKADRVFHSKSA
jgi:hypothetical protein